MWILPWLAWKPSIWESRMSWFHLFGFPSLYLPYWIHIIGETTSLVITTWRCCWEGRFLPWLIIFTFGVSEWIYILIIHITCGLISLITFYLINFYNQCMCFTHLSYDIIRWWTQQFVHLTNPQCDSTEKRTHPINCNELEFIHSNFQLNKEKSNQA